MKKLMLICLVALSLCFCACDAADSGSGDSGVTNKMDAVELQMDASDLVDDINALYFGPEIGDELDRIQSIYDSFPAEIQEKVTNYDYFLELKDSYDSEMDKVQAAIEAIDDLGDIDENSMDAIDNANSIYNGINYLFTDLVTNADKIDTAYETCRQAITDKGVEEAQALIDAGKYQDAINYISDYISEHSSDLNDTSALTEMSHSAELYWAYDLYNKNYLGYVQDILDDLEWASLTSEQASYRDSLQSRLDNYLNSIMPANGTVIARTLGSGYPEFDIYSGDSPLLIKIENYYDSSQYITVFLRPNSSTTFNVPDGYYIAKYATGERYFGNTASKPFGNNTAYLQADDVFALETTREGNYIYYSIQSLYLYAVEGGNLGTITIDGL